MTSSYSEDTNPILCFERRPGFSGEGDAWPHRSWDRWGIARDTIPVIFPPLGSPGLAVSVAK